MQMSTRTACSQSPSPLSLYYSDLYVYQLPPGHRFPMQKYEMVRKQLQANPTMSNTTFKPAPLAKRVDLELVHSSEYISSVLKGTLSASEERAVGFPWSLAGVRRALGSTGGTVAAAREVLADKGHARLCGQTAGGTHHARRGSGAGFCVFNDMAVAACVALRDFDVQRVLFLDLDVHQGDGSAEIFSNDERVYTVSVHGEGNYPFEKEKSNIDVGLPDGAGDEQLLDTVRQVVPRALEQSRPGLIMLQMGVDMLGDDSLGRLSLTRDGLSLRNREVYRMVLEAGIPGVITMGGGYSRPTIDASVAAHCDVYVDAVLALEASGALRRSEARAS